MHEKNDTNNPSELVQGRESQRSWLLLIYQLPKGASSARTAIWREVRRLGVLSLQHAVCLLPFLENNRAGYERIARRIEEYGGEASILDTTSPTDAWHERTVSRFNAARNEEYEEVVAFYGRDSQLRRRLTITYNIRIQIAPLPGAAGNNCRHLK